MKKSIWGTIMIVCSIMCLMCSCTTTYTEAPEHDASLYLINTSSYQRVCLVANQDTLVIPQSELSDVNGWVYFLSGKYSRQGNEYSATLEGKWVMARQLILDGVSYSLTYSQYHKSFCNIRQYTQHSQHEDIFYLQLTDEYLEQVIQ